MRFFYTFILLFFLIPLSIFSDSNFILDDREEKKELTGKWKFLAEEDPQSLDSEPSGNHWKETVVPGFWRNRNLLGMKYGWYYTSIHVSEEFKNINLGLLTGGFLGAQEIYLNGYLIGKTGSIKNNEVQQISAKPEYFQISHKIINTHEYNHLYIKVADSLNVGGIPEPLILGELNLIKKSFYLNSFFKIGIIFSSFLFCLYFFVLFLGFIRDWMYLIYSINLLLFAMFSFSSSRILYWFVDGYYLYYYFINLPLLCLSPLFTIFGFLFFRVKASLLDKIILYSCLPFILVGIILPLGLNPDWFYFRNKYFHDYQLIWYLLLLIPDTKIFFFAIIRKEYGYKLLVFSVIYLLLLVTYNAIMIIKSNNASGEGFLVFLLIFNYLIAQRHSHNQKRIVSIEKNYKENLEREVRQKTYQLSIMNRELIESNQTKDKLFSIISHDLRSPLISLNNLLKIAKKNELNQSDWFFFISNLSEDLERNQFMLENLLQWSAIQLYEDKLPKTECELGQIIKTSVRIAEIGAKEKGIEIAYSPIFVNVFTNPDSIRIVLNNLLNNSIKFSFENSKILIEFTDTSTHIWIRITDFGLGIPSELSDSLFEFDQTKIRKGTKKEKGTGLGLIIVKEILNQLGEDILYEPNLPNGCKFAFSLRKI